MSSSTGQGRWVVLAAVLVGTFTGAINSSIANVAVLDVLDEFDLDISTGAWFVLGYVVAFVVLMPVVGRLAGRIGLRRVYLTGMIVFALASAAAAVGPTYAWVTAARVLQGVGAAPVLPVVMLVVAREFPTGSRGRAMGMWAAMNGAALALGPALGGVITETFGWRMIFWLDVPLALCAFGLAGMALAPDHATSGPRVDLVGVALLGGGSASLMVALSRAPSGGSAGILQLVVAVVGVIGLLGFWRRSSRVPPGRDPVVGAGVLRDRVFVGLAAMAGLQMTLLSVVLFTTPLMLTILFGRSLSVVGLVTFLLPASMVLFGPLSGFLSDRLGARRLAAAGGLLLVGSTSLLAGGVGGRSLSLVVVGLAITGVGVAAIQAPVAVGVAERVADRDRGAAMGLFHSIRFAGAVVGTSMSAAVVELVAGGDVDTSATGDDLRPAFASAYAMTALIAVVLLLVTWRTRPKDLDVDLDPRGPALDADADRRPASEPSSA